MKILALISDLVQILLAAWGFLVLGILLWDWTVKRFRRAPR
jgi:hypothetical protein